MTPIPIPVSTQVSKRFALNWNDGKTILKGAGIALTGALATYLVETVQLVEFGDYNLIAAAIIGILANAMRKFISNNG